MTGRIELKDLQKVIHETHRSLKRLKIKSKNAQLHEINAVLMGYKSNIASKAEGYKLRRWDQDGAREKCKELGVSDRAVEFLLVHGQAIHARAACT